MRIASVAHVKARFSSYLKDSQEGPVIVTRNGKPVAVLLAVQDEDDLERMVLAHSSHLREILERARQKIRAGEGRSHVDFWDEVEAAPPKKRRPKGRKKTT